MGSITDFLAKELLDHVFNASFSPAATLYLCLCTADPTDAATGASMNETANAQSYARTAITFAAAASRTVDQTGDVDFPQASGDYASPITHWAIADTNTYGSGNVYAHGAFAASKTIYSGNTPSVNAGANDVNVTFSAGEISNYLANALLDFAFRNQAFSQPDTYVGYTTETIEDTDTGSSITEVSGGSYARVQVNPNGGSTPTWDNAAGTGTCYVQNTHAVTFTTATASWGTVTSAFVADAVSAGNLLMYDNAMGDQAVGDGDTATFPIGDLDCQMS